MKKIHIHLLAFVMALLPLISEAASFTVDVDNPENIEAGYNKPMFGGLYTQFFPYQLNPGVTTINTSGEESFLIRANANTLAVIDGVTKNGTTVDDLNNIAIEEGMAIVVRTHTEDGSASCTVNCDDFSLVALYVKGSEVRLTSNSQKVDFTRGDVFEIKHSDPDKRLAEVKLNNEVQSSGFGNSYILQNVSDNDIIDVRSTFGEFNITFSFNNDIARSYITRVEVNAVEVPDYAAGMRVTEGSSVAMKINTALEGVEVKVNGVARAVNPMFHEISFIVEKDSEVEVIAPDEVEPELTVVDVDVDKAANIKLYYVEPGIIPVYNKNIPFSLIDGENKIEIPENVVTIYAEPEINCSFTEVKCNGEDVTPDPTTGNYAFTVAPDMNILIRTMKLEASSVFTLVCQEPSKIRMQLGGSDYQLSDEAEQTIRFIPETQNNVRIEAAQSQYFIKDVLHNGNPVEKLGESFGGTPYYLVADLQNNDVITVNMAETCEVAFIYEKDANPDYIERVTVNDTPRDDFKEGIVAPLGANLSLCVLSAVTDQEIYVNGKLMTPDNLSLITFVLEGNTEIMVRLRDSSIFGTAVDACREADIYGLDGTLILKNAGKAMLRNLPEGVYIVNGKKIIVTR